MQKYDYEDDYEKLLAFGKAIVPQSWNVYKYCDIKSIKEDKGILNVELHIYDYYSRRNRGKHWAGHAEDIRYINGVGYTKVNIHCSEPMEKPCVLLHELAHVAHMRLISFQTKQYKEDYARVDVPPADVHGKILTKLVNIFVNRAIRNDYTMFNDFIVRKGGKIVPKPLPPLTEEEKEVWRRLIKI